jgi:Protein of unknown function (DUF4240)
MSGVASELLGEKRFWQIIERSLDGTDSVGLTMKRQTQLLERELQELSREEFVGFAYLFSEFYSEACREDLWAVAYVVMGGCSDDCFMDFRKWLVTRGRSVYEAALRDPDSLCGEFDKIPTGEIPLWEYYLEKKFDARFGAGAYNRVYDGYGFADLGPNRIREPDNRWSGDDEASVKRLCPNVFATYWDNRRF